MCEHRNLHPGRFDGSKTVCLDCGEPVAITTLVYLSGETTQEQADAALLLCENDRATERSE